MGTLLLVAYCAYGLVASPICTSQCLGPVPPALPWANIIEFMSPTVKDRPAAVSAAWMSCDRPPAGVMGFGTRIPNINGGWYEAATIPTDHPASRKTLANWIANCADSTSFMVCERVTDPGPTAAKAVLRFGNCSSDKTRQPNCDLSRAVSRSASAILRSDRLFNSAWRLEAIRPNCTSPATPRKTNALASDDPHRSQNESYGGWIAAIANSAKTPKARMPAQYHAHDSQESIDWSNSSLLAFLNPYPRRQAGNFRGFWFGVGTGALMFVVLFAIAYLAK